MSSSSDPSPQSDAAKLAAYTAVRAQLRSFWSDCSGGGAVDTCGRMATLNAFLARAFPSWHFVGFYTAAGGAGAPLTIGPFQGDVLATARIAWGAGQCGACAASAAPTIAPDVSVCANYIPCDDVTRSEIVMPVFGRNAHCEAEAAHGGGLMPWGAAAAPGARRLIAVLDIDSPVLANFNEVDSEQLAAIHAEHF
jgi:GAF domain-containing protein